MEGFLGNPSLLLSGEFYIGMWARRAKERDRKREERERERRERKKERGEERKKEREEKNLVCVGKYNLN